MEIMRASQGSCYCFRKFQEKNPSDLETVHTNYMKRSLNINKHTSSLCVYEELDRFPITHRAWSMALNTGCESPLEHRTGYWMRHIKPLFTRKITGCSAFRPYWILMDLVMFGLTPSVFVPLFTNCLNHVWTISSNRKGEAIYSPQVDLTHWNISSKMIVKNHTYTKLEILVLRKFLLHSESTRTFYQHAVSTKQLHLPAHCVPENRCLFCTLFWNVLCMIDSAIFYWQNCFAFTVFPEFRLCSEAKICCRPRLSARGH